MIQHLFAEESLRILVTAQRIPSTSKVIERPLLVGILGNSLAVVAHSLFHIPQFIVLVGHIAVYRPQLIPIDSRLQIIGYRFAALVRHAV